MHAQDERLDQREVSVQSAGFLSWANWTNLDFNELESTWLELDRIFEVL